MKLPILKVFEIIFLLSNRKISVIQLAKSRERGFRNLENIKAVVYFLGNKEINTIYSF